MDNRSTVGKTESPILPPVVSPSTEVNDALNKSDITPATKETHTLSPQPVVEADISRDEDEAPEREFQKSSKLQRRTFEPSISSAPSVTSPLTESNKKEPSTDSNKKGSLTDSNKKVASISPVSAASPSWVLWGGLIVLGLFLHSYHSCEVITHETQPLLGRCNSTHTDPATDKLPKGMWKLLHFIVRVIERSVFGYFLTFFAVWDECLIHMQAMLFGYMGLIVYLIDRFTTWPNNIIFVLGAMGCLLCAALIIWITCKCLIPVGLLPNGMSPMPPEIEKLVCQLLQKVINLLPSTKRKIE
jgi:hypothetical protein